MDTRTLCLGAISMGDQTGYEIKKRFEESFSFFLDVSTSGIYRALGDLEADGAITTEPIVQQGRPNKKSLTLTDVGQKQLVAAMLATPARHRVRSDLLFSLLFAHLLPEEHIEEMLDRHIEEMQAMVPITQAWLAEFGDNAPAGTRLVARFALDMIDAHLTSLERHRPLLQGAGSDVGNDVMTSSQTSSHHDDDAETARKGAHRAAGSQ